MSNLFKIKPNTTNKVRFSLHIEDIKMSNLQVLEEFGLIQKLTVDRNGTSFDVIVFKEPFRVPKFNVFYASPISRVGDPYLVELIKRIVYLNPEPDILMRKRITEAILMNFVRTECKESELHIGKYSEVPVLTYEQVQYVVDAVVGNMRETGYVPDNEDVLLFSKDNELSKEDKIGIRAGFRAKLAVEFFEKAIHAATELLIEQDELVKVTSSRIQDTRLVTTENRVASTQTIRKYMSTRTKKVIDEHNSYAPFKSLAAQQKFMSFLKYREAYPNPTLSEICSMFNVSRSTAVEFRELSMQKFNY